MRKLLLFIPLCLLASACKQTPGYVIPEDDMAELLADLQTANAVVELNPNAYKDDSLKKALKQSVYIKHNTTQEQFDTSLMWYGHNLDIYHEVYENVVTILEDRQKDVQKEARAAGEKLIATGDSVDIWSNSHNLIFDRRQVGESMLLTFSIPTDNDSRNGDRYVWKFKLTNARRPADLLIGVDYADGSSEYQTKSTTPDYATDITLQADSTKAVSRLYGYLHYRIQTESAVFVDRITLTRTRLNPANYSAHPYQRKIK